MQTNYGQIWSSRINCQQFAQLFVIDGLDLNWPDNIDIDDDILPISIDIRTFSVSEKNNRI